MLWAALLFPLTSTSTPTPIDALHGPAAWALQFTPRVALCEEAVLMELERSTRLFGGRGALRERVRREAADLGATAQAWASNSMAAMALARAGIDNGFNQPLGDLLDALPMHTLSATAPHHTTLRQLGCRTLGHIRRLPRGGIGRRFGHGLLQAMDQAYGLQPEAHVWFEQPQTFKSRIELPSRVETAPALCFGARRLLLQLCGWLAARHAGTCAFTLRWAHDAMRSKHAGEGGELTVRTAHPMRDVDHLSRLLAEHLARVSLQAPVGDLELEAIDVVPFAHASGTLLPDPAQSSEALDRVLERIAARLGADRVLRPVLEEDHRVEWTQRWQPALAPLPRKRSRHATTPQPTFIVPEPLRLAVRGHRPVYQGALHLLSGPHRVEGGWWHRVALDGGAQDTRHVSRDYWVALSPRAGVLWVFQERLASETAWYLHGMFA